MNNDEFWNHVIQLGGNAVWRDGKLTAARLYSEAEYRANEMRKIAKIARKRKRRILKSGGKKVL